MDKPAVLIGITLYSVHMISQPTLVAYEGDYSRPQFLTDSKTVSPAPETVEERFSRLCKEWKKETSHISVLEKRYRHPSYREILTIKEAAIPLILKEMRRDPDWWFDALERLTKKNPAKNAETFYEGVDEWISWGIANEIIA